MTNSENNKESKARPFSVSKETFEENWNRIFRCIPKSDFFMKRRDHGKKNWERSPEERIQSDLE